MLQHGAVGSVLLRQAGWDVFVVAQSRMLPHWSVNRPNWKETKFGSVLTGAGESSQHNDPAM